MARRKKRSRRGRSRGRRRNAGMPVVLVNPSGRGRRRKRRRGRRRNPAVARRSNPRRRRRNPRSPTWGKALVAFGLSGLGGGLGYGIDWGVSHAKIGAGWQAAAFGVTGSLGSIALAKWGDERLAAGLAGATIAMTIGRVREVIALSKLASTKPAAETKPAVGEAGAVYRQPYRDAGAVYPRPDLRAQARAPALMGPTWKEAGAVRRNPSYYVPGPVRHYGPRSWVYGTGGDAGAVVRRYVSAHSSSR